MPAIVDKLQPSFAGGEIAPSLHGRVDLAAYAIGLKTCRNFFVHAHGGVSNRPGFRYVGDAKHHDRKCRLIPFVFNDDQTYVLEFGDRYVRVIQRGGYVVGGDGKPYEIATPYLETDLPRLQCVQSADVMVLAHPNRAPRELRRKGHADWEIVAMGFAPKIAAPTIASIWASLPAANHPTMHSATYHYCVTAVDEDGQESVASAAKAFASVKFGTSVLYDGQYYYPTIGLSWGAVASAVQYNVYRAENGVYGRIGIANGASFTDDNFVADLSLTPPDMRSDLFAGSGKYPACAAYHQQRLWFGGTNKKPQTIWASRLGDFDSFATSTPPRDDDSLEFTLAAREVNEIRHLLPLGDLIVLTSGGEWRMGGGGAGDAITPTSVSMKPQGYRGAAYVPPIVSGNVALYVQARGARVRDLAYDFQADGYVGNDLSIRAEHLFAGRWIVEWAYAQEPYSIVWAVRDDGALLGLTYHREHQVFAWHRHDTAGAFESVCVVPEGGEDAVYVVVKRTVGGQVKRFVERLETRRVAAVEDAFFVDSGLSYAGAATTAVSGLDHLEGREVAILADGAVLPRQTVTGGAVTLPKPASKIHVGLPYVCDLKTLPIDFDGQGTQAKRKLIPSVAARIKKSRGLKAGPDATRLVEVKERTTEAWGEATALKSGVVEIGLPPDWGQDGSVFIRQDAPLPLTILSLTPKVAVGG